MDGSAKKALSEACPSLCLQAFMYIFIYVYACTCVCILHNIMNNQAHTILLKESSYKEFVV